MRGQAIRFGIFFSPLFCYSRPFFSKNSFGNNAPPLSDSSLVPLPLTGLPPQLVSLDGHLVSLAAWRDQPIDIPHMLHRITQSTSNCSPKRGPRRLRLSCLLQPSRLPFSLRHLHARPSTSTVSRRRNKDPRPRGPRPRPPAHPVMAPGPNPDLGGRSRPCTMKGPASTQSNRTRRCHRQGKLGKTNILGSRLV